MVKILWLNCATLMNVEANKTALRCFSIAAVFSVSG